MKKKFLFDGAPSKPKTHRYTRTIIAPFALLAAISGISAEPSQPPIQPNTTLGTKDQVALEKLRLRIIENVLVKEQRQLSVATYRSDPQAKTIAGQSTLEKSLDAITAAMVETAVNSDTSRPKIMWVVNAARNWFSEKVPASGYGIDNPDNVYRHIPMDGQSHYVITGKLRNPSASQLSFTLYSELPGTSLTLEGSGMIGALSQLKTNPDGTFTLTVDPEPANGRPNHIQSQAKTAMLIVRDTLADWSHENVSTLRIERIAGPTPPAVRTEAEIAAHAVQLMKQAIPYWLQYDNQFVFSLPANHVAPPTIRSTGWGLLSMGHFDLSDNEALLVTIDSLGAKYVGFQLANPWGVAVEYTNRTGSLNIRQARPNRDGTYTYVISVRDPGVYNWLDPSGLNAGIFNIRWQNLPAPVTSTESAVKESRVVNLEQLQEALPDGTPLMTTTERAEQKKIRAMSYLRRLSN